MLDTTERVAHDRAGLLHWQSTRNKTVFRMILVSALLVIALRTLAPFEVGKDQASQLEAAQNLINGKGLITTAVSSTSFDITVDPSPRYLTWWPPGFSLIVAAFLGMGFSLLVSLKLIYAIVTLAGWIGWGLVASALLNRSLVMGDRVYPVHLVIAPLLPVFFTLGWNGTDIFLWAGIPFVLLLLFKQRAERISYIPLIGSGLLFGALYAIRYASLFLALAALLTLLQVCFPKYKTALLRFALFNLSSLLFILPTYLYTKLYAVGVTAISDRATLGRLTSNLSTVIDGIFQKLPITANMLFGTPLPDLLLLKFNSRLLLYVSGIACVAILCFLPFFLAEQRRKTGQKIQHDLALSVWTLPVALLTFLITINFAVRLGLVGIRRYYEPLQLCGVLIFYQMAALRLTRSLVTHAARAVVVCFLLYICVYLPALAFVHERNGHLVNTVLGFVPANNIKYRGTSYGIRYPSFMLYSNKENNRQKLRALAEADPSALFFVEEYAYFAYDDFQGGAPIPGKTLRVFSRFDYWQHAYTSQPVKVFWVVNEQTDLDRIDGLSAEVVFSDPVEKTKIIKAEFPAGHHFAHDHVAKN